MGAYLILTSMIRYVPGLTFNTVSGSWGNFHINSVFYDTSIGSVEVNECSISLNLKYIWNRQIYVDHLFLKDVFIKLKKTDVVNREDKRYVNLKISNVLPFAFPVIVKNMVLCNTCIISEVIIIELKKLDAGLILRNNSLIVLPVYIKGIVVNISNVRMSNIKTSIINWCKCSNQQNIKYIVRLFLNKLPALLSYYDFSFDVTLKKIIGDDLYIFDENRCYSIIASFCLQTYLSNHSANAKLDIKLPCGYFHAVGSLMFKGFYPIDMTATYTSYNNTNSNIYNVVDNAQDVNNIHLTIVGDLYNELCLRCDVLGLICAIHILLKINLTQFGIPISISIVGNKIPIFFLRKYGYLLEEINFNCSGKIEDYYIRVTSQLSSSKLPSIYIIMNAKGGINSCTISKLKIAILGGYLNMQGVVNWGNSISWNNVFVLNKINIFQKWLKYPIELSGNIETRGSVSFNAWEIGISNVNISGKIKNNHILCSGALYGNSMNVWKIPIFFVRCGSNVLEVRGELKEDYILNIMLKAPNCNFIIPELMGSIYGTCKLYGPIKCPRLLLNLNVGDLSWCHKNISINKIMVNSDIYYNSFMKSKFFLQMDNIKYGVLSVRKVVVIGQGNITQHYLKLTACDDKLFGQVKVRGNLDILNKIWNGKVEKTSIITPIGTWKLMQDVVCSYQHVKRKIIIDSHYWDIFDCTIPIVDILKIRTLGKIDTILQRFNIIPVKIVLPECIHIHTVRLYCINCYWTLGVLLPEGIISCLGTQLSIISSVKEKDIIAVQVDNVSAKIVMKANVLTCKWFVNIGANEQSSGVVKIVTYYDRVSEIIGSIQIKDISLEPFWKALIVSEVSISGLLNLNIRFHKCAQNFKIYGFTRLQYFNLNKFDKLSFIDNGQLFIKFFEDHAILNGIINTDHGCKLYLNGDIVNFDSICNTRVSCTIRGHQINLNVFPEIKAKISPDVFCVISSEGIYIQGRIVIPWARIVCKESIKNIARVSSEEILMDENLKPILDSSKNLAVSVVCNVSVCLGNNVYFNGLGLRAQLKGDLEIEYIKNNLVLTGHIDMSSGVLQIYGQHLTIKKGQLLFSGMLHQPYVDIEVICNSSHINDKDEIIVGLRITGLFDQPKLEMFSNLSLFSSQEMMHYLIGTRRVMFANADTNIIASLLIGAGVHHSEKFVNKIGKIFGVQDLELNTQDIGTTPFLALSGYIAPGLQIKYGVNIFDLSTTITASYSVVPKLCVEITSGSSQACDVLYKFNF